MPARPVHEGDQRQQGAVQSRDSACSATSRPSAALDRAAPRRHQPLELGQEYRHHLETRFVALGTHALPFVEQQPAGLAEAASADEARGQHRRRRVVERFELQPCSGCQRTLEVRDGIAGHAFEDLEVRCSSEHAREAALDRRHVPPGQAPHGRAERLVETIPVALPHLAV